MEVTNLSKIKREKLLETISKLKQQLSDEEIKKNLTVIENELNEKKYGLIWEEHEERVDVELKDNIPVFNEMSESDIMYDKDKKVNFLIKGDNLHSLYLLNKTHKDRIDIIYIDPPYNTGQKDFSYGDEILDKNDGFKHSKWLSFMSRRLNIAKDLLSKKGIIFISIDDNEYAELKMLCDDIFGEKNYVSTLHWKKKKQPSYLHGQVAGVMEYILIYSKCRANLDKLSLSNPTDSNTRVDNANNQLSERIIKKGIRVKLDPTITIIPAGIYKNKTMSTEFLDDVYIENGRTTNEFRAKACFRDSQDRINIFCDNDVFFITKNYGFRRDKLQEELEKKKAITDLILDWGDNQDSDKELRDIFKEKVFDYPKPVLLIKNIIKSTDYKNCIVLDFFAGSGTTGQAVLELNKEDDGNRQFILCTNNENEICDKITYPRLKTVISGLRLDNSKYSDGIHENLLCYDTAFIPRVNSDEHNLYDNLLNSIKNLIQLENGIIIDYKKVHMYLDEDSFDNFCLNDESLNVCEKVYISSDILLTNKEKQLLSDYNIEMYVIPEYYFEQEIKEAL